MDVKISFTQLRFQSMKQAFCRKAARKELEFHRNKRILSNGKMDNSYVQMLRKFSKEDARYYHVAYSLMRGNNYSQIERTCRTPLDPGRIFDILKTHNHECTLRDVIDLLDY